MATIERVVAKGKAAIALLTRDARHGQIVTLGSLLALGLSRLGFDIEPTQVAVTIVTALAVQVICDRLVVGRAFTAGLKSALISSLSLCLLLRTDTLWLAAAGSAIAVSSKFLLRVRGKHVFNPTNLALAVLMAATPGVWISPGQWGSQATLAFGFACAGLLVTNRAARFDVTLAFMTSWTVVLVARSLALHEPMTIPFHRLESGAFLLFSFFMISDPKTTPDARAARVLFAALVALGAWYVQFRLFRTNGFVWALACASPLVPLLDWLLPTSRYEWSDAARQPPTLSSPGSHASAQPSVALAVLHPHHGGLR